MSTFIIATIVFIMMAFAIKSIIKSKKNGQCCGSSCEGCGGHCQDLHK